MTKEEVIAILQSKLLLVKTSLIYEYLLEKGIDKNRIEEFINVITNNLEHQLNSSIVRVTEFCGRYYMTKHNICALIKDDKIILYY